MAKLSITRPKMQRIEYAMPTRRRPGYEIVIDGRCVRWIEPGETIELELPSGRHQVRARSFIHGSQTDEIDCTPDEMRHFAVGFSSRWQKLHLLAGVFMILSILPTTGISLSLSQQMRPGAPATLDTVWLKVGMFSIAFLLAPALLFLVYVLVFYRNHVLDLLEIPARDLTHPQIAAFLRSQPFRLRITIRHLMIAVAILAVIIAVAMQWFRHEGSNEFERRARHHARLAALCRKYEYFWIRMAGDFEKSSTTAAGPRKTRGSGGGESRLPRSDETEV